MTQRGKVVVGTVVVLLVVAFSQATRDVCWVGPKPWNYGSCQALVDRMVKQSLDVPVVEVDRLEKFRTADKLSEVDLAELLWLVGFRDKELKTAWAIAMRESNGRPEAHNSNVKTGDNSYGVFQINMLGNLGEVRRDLFDIAENTKLFDPVINAQIAFYMSKGGQDWSSWKGVTPRAAKILKDFPQLELKDRIKRYS